MGNYNGDGYHNMHLRHATHTYYQHPLLAAISHGLHMLAQKNGIEHTSRETARFRLLCDVEVADVAPVFYGLWVALVISTDS